MLPDAIALEVLPRSLLVILAGLVACAGGDQNQPSGATLGSASDSSQDTDVPTTGISAGNTTDSGPSVTSDASVSTRTSAVESSTTDNTAGSTGGVDGSTSTGRNAQSWQRYSLDTATGTWSQVPLDEIWVGDNAPPSTGITATTSLTHFDRLFVISDEGMVYEQADGVWLTPEPTSQRFPAAADLSVNAMVHTPGQESDDVEELFLIATPVAVVYRQFENGGLELAQVADQVDTEGQAPQGTVDNLWIIGQAEPEGIGMDADWLVWHMAFANDELWRFNAAFEWVLAPIDDNEYFSGAAGEPDPFSIEAAYYDDAFGRAHFIAP